MVGNMKDVMDMYQRFRQNPMQMLNQKFNIPQNVNMSNPNDIIQHLLNTSLDIRTIQNVSIAPNLKKLKGEKKC